LHFRQSIGEYIERYFRIFVVGSYRTVRYGLATPEEDYAVKKSAAHRHCFHGSSAAVCDIVGSMGSAAAKIVRWKQVRLWLK
jgi:hypothetical protein